MSPNERLRRLQKRLDLNLSEIALIFGCGEGTARNWLYDLWNMSPDFYATLLRIECDNIEQLAPKLRKDTIEAFNAGRRRGILEKRDKLLQTGAIQ